MYNKDMNPMAYYEQASPLSIYKEDIDNARRKTNATFTGAIRINIKQYIYL